MKSANRDLLGRFEIAYRKPGVKYMGAACTMGLCTIIGFYLLDIVHTGLPWIGGVQTFRLFLAGLCVVVATVSWADAAFATRYYGQLFGTVVIILVTGACFIGYRLHHDDSPAALFTGLERAWVICLVVVSGFSRLSALRTIAIVAAVPIPVIAVLWATMGPDVTPQVARMLMQLVLVGTCCFLLRRTIQAREFDLFVLAGTRAREASSGGGGCRQE
jgi:hypothetical protein